MKRRFLLLMFVLVMTGMFGANFSLRAQTIPFGFWQTIASGGGPYSPILIEDFESTPNNGWTVLGANSPSQITSFISQGSYSWEGIASAGNYTSISKSFTVPAGGGVIKLDTYQGGTTCTFSLAVAGGSTATRTSTAFGTISVSVAAFAGQSKTVTLSITSTDGTSTCQGWIDNLRFEDGVSCNTATEGFEGTSLPQIGWSQVATNTALSTAQFTQGAKSFQGTRNIRGVSNGRIRKTLDTSNCTSIQVDVLNTPTAGANDCEVTIAGSSTYYTNTSWSTKTIAFSGTSSTVIDFANTSIGTCYFDNVRFF